MIPLVIDIEAKEAIGRVRTYAEDPANINVLSDHPTSPAPGDVPAHVIHLQVGFKVVYSVDLDKEGRRWKHLSMSVAGPGRVPHPEAVKMVCKEFGIANPGLYLVDGIAHAVAPTGE